jgi:hypothetical protein
MRVAASVAVNVSTVLFATEGLPQHPNIADVQDPAVFNTHTNECVIKVEGARPMT